MPLLKTWTEENGRWGIWQVTETLEELYACLSDDVVRQELERLKAPSRKMEYLAVRVLLKTMLGKEARIGHEPSGKPFLSGGEYHVSISHTKGYVAVGLHESAQPGIDIEAYGGRVRKVESRFVREDEMPEGYGWSRMKNCISCFCTGRPRKPCTKCLIWQKWISCNTSKCVLLNYLPPERLRVNHIGKRTRPVS